MFRVAFNLYRCPHCFRFVQLVGKVLEEHNEMTPEEQEYERKWRGG